MSKKIKIKEMKSCGDNKLGKWREWMTDMVSKEWR